MNTLLSDTHTPPSSSAHSPAPRHRSNAEATIAPSTDSAAPGDGNTDSASRIHDLVGIGIGPFGLGLAALAEPLTDVDAVFLDQRDEFRWHPGMMIEGATIQVPFLADLVTMADPTSPFSFLSFLKDRGRLYPFFIRESFYPLRAEFDEYCRWVSAQLDTLRWNRRVTSVTREGEIYVVHAEVTDASGRLAGTETYRARHIVLGVGTSPVLPEALRGLMSAGGQTAASAEATASPEATAGTEATTGPIIHTADYLDHREQLLESGSVTIVGSGQSAAEVYRDLIEDAEARGVRVEWLTRSPRFFPMEYTKLTLEMTSPEYTDHFRALPDDLRGRIGREQRTLYKGISGDLIDDIHDTLYRLSRGGRRLLTNLFTDAELIAAAPAGRPAGESDAEVSGEYLLEFRNTVLDRRFTRRTGAIVAATGYRPGVPDFLDPIRDEIRFDDQGRLDAHRDYTLNEAGTIHSLGIEEHTHGVTAPDLGFGPWRASVVLSRVTGREPYPIERSIAFQTFGIPDFEAGDAEAGESEEGAAVEVGADDRTTTGAEADASAVNAEHRPSAEPHPTADDRSKEMTHA